ncbi:hypothetical protein ABPG75_005712 [Micractinium tetrahymenae]
MGEVIDLTCSQDDEEEVEAAVSLQPPLKKARSQAATEAAAATATDLVQPAAIPTPAAAEFGSTEAASEAAAAGPSGSGQQRVVLAGPAAAGAAAGGAGGGHRSPAKSRQRSATAGTSLGSHPMQLLSPLHRKLLLWQAQREVLRYAFADLCPQQIRRHQLQRALRMCRCGPHSPPLEDPAEQRHFSVVSYNIWFDPTMGPERMAAIGRLIEHDCHLPDVVLLQEVTHHFYLTLAAQPFWRHYHASPMPPPSPLPGWGPDDPSPIFTVILWRKDRVAGGRYEPAHAYANSVMYRDLKSVVCSIGGTRLRASTTHLESPLGGPHKTYWKERAAQHDEMMGVLECQPELNSVVAGDMNWIPIKGEDQPSPLPPGWQDAWLALRPGEQGWTFDTNICPQKGKTYKNGARLDRLYFRLADWAPLAVERVGMEPIPGLLPRVIRTGKTARSDKVVGTWPSDHFGLYALFVRRGVLGPGC